MPSYYEETKELLEQIEINTRDGGGGSDPGGGSTVGLTNEELRAAAVPVSGPATNAQIRATPIAISISTVTLTPSLELITSAGAGTVASGAQSVSFSNYGPGDVTVAGGTLPATRGVNFDGGIHRLGSISYSVPSGTSLQIAQVR